jgi:hypothetical protein
MPSATRPLRASSQPRSTAPKAQQQGEAVLGRDADPGGEVLLTGGVVVLPEPQPPGRAQVRPGEGERVLERAGMGQHLVQPAARAVGIAERPQTVGRIGDALGAHVQHDSERSRMVVDAVVRGHAGVGVREGFIEASHVTERLCPQTVLIQAPIDARRRWHRLVLLQNVESAAEIRNGVVVVLLDGDDVPEQSRILDTVGELARPPQHRPELGRSLSLQHLQGAHEIGSEGRGRAARGRPSGQGGRGWAARREDPARWR